MHYLGRTRFDIPDDETFFHPKANPGRTRGEQVELENGMREEQAMQAWMERQGELQLMNDAKNY